jgi:hypothetical protein
MIITMSNERDKLAARMVELCDLLGLDKQRRQTLLAKKYKKSITTGRNWLLGLKVPEYEIACQMCADANINYEWLLTGYGLKLRTSEENVRQITDPDIIKIVDIAEELPGFAKKMAVKEVDNVRQFAKQAQQEYSDKPNGTEK